MKVLILPLFLLIAVQAFAQSDTLSDARDGQRYAIREINGTWWMLDNLNYETARSLALPEHLRDSFPDIHGRWYHQSDLAEACPAGWELPRTEDWLAYFSYISQQKFARYKLSTFGETVQVHGYEKKLDLFEEGNPLHIGNTGIFEGGVFYLFHGGQADYWIQDMPSREMVKADKAQYEDLNYKAPKELYPGTTHIHISRPYTNLHSHDHHLNPQDPETLRLFMIRCVKE